MSILPLVVAPAADGSFAVAVVLLPPGLRVPLLRGANQISGSPFAYYAEDDRFVNHHHTAHTNAVNNAR